MTKMKGSSDKAIDSLFDSQDARWCLLPPQCLAQAPTSRHKILESYLRYLPG